MRPYGEFQPTAFDRRGLFLPERHNWLVAPVSQTRDSGPLEQSNFETALAELGGESDAVEVHRFGHWGPGWYEIILIDPADAGAVDKARGMEERLADYPILDEEDFSRRELEAAEKAWAAMGRASRAYALERYGRGVSIFAIRRDELPSEDSGDLISYLVGD